MPTFVFAHTGSSNIPLRITESTCFLKDIGFDDILLTTVRDDAEDQSGRSPDPEIRETEDKLQGHNDQKGLKS